MNKIKHRKSKFLCILLSCILILTMSGSVYAKRKPTSGRAGKYITWDYNKETKTLRFSGKGKMQDTIGTIKKNGEIGGWSCWSEEADEIVIGEGITEVGEGNF